MDSKSSSGAGPKAASPKAADAKGAGAKPSGFAGAAGKAKGASGEFWTGPLGPDAFEKAMGGHRHALEQIAEVQQMMLARMQELQELELDYAGKLAACASPSEAIEVMAKWTAARMEAILDGQREMQRVVLDALSKASDEVRKTTGGR